MELLFSFFFKVVSELGARFGRLVNECLVHESWSQSKFMSSHQLNLMCNSVPENEVVTFPAQRQGKHGCLEIASGVFFSSAFSQSIATFQGSSLKNCSRKLQHLRLCASSQDKNKANHSRSNGLERVRVRVSRTNIDRKYKIVKRNISDALLINLSWP